MPYVFLEGTVNELADLLGGTRSSRFVFLLDSSLDLSALLLDLKIPGLNVLAVAH